MKIQEKLYWHFFLNFLDLSLDCIYFRQLHWIVSIPAPIQIIPKGIASIIPNYHSIHIDNRYKIKSKSP